MRLVDAKILCHECGAEQHRSSVQPNYMFDHLAAEYQGAAEAALGWQRYAYHLQAELFFEKLDRFKRETYETI